ncbi:unnamed protein product [Closterium sp. Yama58-4]|nr:unnamed protein product [Closterium sp. Yama58-4]
MAFKNVCPPLPPSPSHLSPRLPQPLPHPPPRLPVTASGESEVSTWIEAVHLVLPPVIPRSSSEATLDALQAPNGTAGMEPLLDAKWEAGFKGTKRVFACLLLLGCLLYIAAFLSGIIVNSTTGAPAAANTSLGNPPAAALPSHASSGGDSGSSISGLVASMLTSQTLWIAMSYLILYLVIASLGLAGAHYNNVSMMSLYIFIQATVTIISVLDSVRPFLLFCILLILLAIHIRFHMLSVSTLHTQYKSDGGGAGIPFNVFPAQSYLNFLNINIPLPRLPQLPFPFKDKFNKFHKSPPPSPPPPSPSPPPPSPPPPKNKSPPPPKKSPPPPEKKSPPPPEHKSPPPPEHKSPPPPEKKSPPPPKRKSPPPPEHKSPPPPEKKSPPPPKHKSPPPPEKKSPPPPEHKSPPPPKHKSPPPPEKKSPPPPEHKSPPPPKHKSPPPPKKKSPPPPKHKSPPPPEKKSPPPPKHKSPPPPEKKSPPPPEKKSPPPPEKKSPPPPSPSPPPPPPPRKPSKKDKLIIILLKGAAVLVRKAHSILPSGNDAQKEALWAVVTALGDAEVLINEGRRELVREQLDNSVVTLEEVRGEVQGGWVQEQAAAGMIGLARVEIMKAQALFRE